MDQETFDERVKRLHDVNAAISKLEPTIQAAAFEILKSYVTGRQVATTATRLDEGETATDADSVSLEAFLKQHAAPGTKPAESVLMITAYFYSRYGNEPFSIDDIRRTADDAGLTIPSRV